MPEPIVTLRPATLIALGLLALALVAFTALDIHDPGLIGREPMPTDFDIFHLVGRMSWAGTLDDAYVAELFVPLQHEIHDDGTFMPWTYPPQFDLVVAALALLPAWLAYVAFISATAAAYLLLLRRIAAEHVPVAVTSVLLAAVVNMRSGQNGFLTASLAGAFVLLCLRGSRGAGLPLGLMAIKPHLALGLGAFLLLSRRWAWASQALAVVAGTALLSAAAFGPGIWPAFVNGVEESKAFLEAGQYPLYRMTSVYAGLRSLGLGPQLALGAQAFVALTGLGAVARAVAGGWRTERTLAVAVMASLAMSPYLYDYDLTMLGIVIALVAKDLALHASRPWRLAILGLCWLAGGYGLVATSIVEAQGAYGSVQPGSRPCALGAFALLALMAALLSVLRKAERDGRRQAEGAVPA